MTPADLGGGVSIQPPKSFSIPIGIDLKEKLRLPADSSLYQTNNFSVGTVTVADGLAYFNGQPLQDDAAHRLSQLCQRRFGG